MTHSSFRFSLRFVSFLLVLVSLPAFANASATLSFEFDTQGPLDEHLIERLEKRQVFERLRRFSEQDLKLKQDIVYHIQHPLDSQAGLIDTPEAPEEDTRLHIYLPFSYLYQLDQGLINKYAEQPDIQEAIYGAAVEKYLWFELGRALIDQFDLGVSGQEVFALDNFSTLMLLNLGLQESDYILDATEAFLLIDQSLPFAQENDYEAEISLDEQRYRKVVCLILGKDYLSHLKQNALPYQAVLEELAWDQKKIEQCQELYLQKLQTWVAALQPHLRESNQLKHWLAAQ
jgi:Putative metallopeptidase